MRIVYGSESPYKMWKASIAAQYNSVSLDTCEYDVAGNSDSMEANVWKKTPYLEIDAGVIGSSNAIARYIARMRGDTQLFGNKFSEKCQIDTWIEFTGSQMEIPACLLSWVSAKLFENPGEATLKRAFADIERALQVLEKHLSSSSGNAYLVGNEVTLADIVLICTLVDPFELVFAANDRKKFPTVEKYFKKCVAFPEFQSVLQGRGTKLCTTPFRFKQ